ELTEEQLHRLEDRENGGFFMAGESDQVLFRSKEVFDGALPATNGMAARVLLELAARHDRERWWKVAERTLRAFGVAAEHQPEGARTLNAAVRRYHLASEAPEPEAAVQATVMNLVEKAARAVVQTRLELDPVPAPSPTGSAGGADGSHRFRLELRIKEGWHLYAHGVGKTFTATTLEAAEGHLEDVSYPEGDALRADGDDAVSVYHGTVAVEGRIVGGTAVQLTYQPCDDRRCLAPTRVRVEAETPATH
ncbi:MAG: hypothetical protein MI919_03750, partial [Holophagales bacterium]|nr:hypothetical protein [Holophagales bacterium]